MLFCFLLAISHECTFGRYRERRALGRLPEGIYRAPEGKTLVYIEKERFEACEEGSATIVEANVKAAIAEFEQKTRFRFELIEEARESTVMIWISTNEGENCRQYCQVPSIGMAHPEGTFDSSQNFMNLGSCFRNVGLIIHEFGHFLGLEHEQKRDDSGKYLSISRGETGWNNWRNQWIKEEGHTYSTFNTDFDFCSIMMYSVKTGNKLWNDNNVNVTNQGYNAMVECMNENPAYYGRDCRTVSEIKANFEHSEKCENAFRQFSGLSKRDVIALGGQQVQEEGEESETIWIPVIGGALAFLVVVFICYKLRPKPAQIEELL